MASADFEYIPAGTLRVPVHAHGVPLNWAHTLYENENGQYGSDHLHALACQHPFLKPFEGLAREKWIRLGFGLCQRATDEESLLVRVHVLPDDRHRNSIDRSSARLRRPRLRLLNLLDWSHVAWQGHPGASSLQSRAKSPSDSTTGGSDAGSSEQSLLQIFNAIPSPDPAPEKVVDPETQRAMLDLLEGRVQGLKTGLYPYQRRSAAAMLQRENEPGQVLDPRFTLLTDQDGVAWYYDHVGGTPLRDPPYYNGIAGGILAEEMGAGKTLVCLSLVLTSRRFFLRPPDIYETPGPPVRKKVGSLMQMAASCATRHGVPWRDHFEERNDSVESPNCVRALESDPGFYMVPTPEPATRPTRQAIRAPKPERPPLTKMYLSGATLIVVPANLLQQWQQEIKKHTTDFRAITIARNDYIPNVNQLVRADVVLFSQPRFEKIIEDQQAGFLQHIKSVHFKRCIVDEGHRLGNSRMGAKSNLLLALDELQIGHRWVVTGTPSRGLYGVEASAEDASQEDSAKRERADLERIGSLATLYLQARPWANTLESGDTVANWNLYMMERKNKRDTNASRMSCLKATLNSLIIRHQLSDVSKMLPRVTERIVRLRGSYQDRLATNVFSMMIVFNAVQSQRTDQDYFFHPRQHRFLVELVRNMRQATFFGASFFPPEDIAKSVETASSFADNRAEALGVSEEDMAVLYKALTVGHLAAENHLRRLSHQFHEIPVLVADFPVGAGFAWSLDGEAEDDDGLVCTSSSLLQGLQRAVKLSLKDATLMNTFVNGDIIIRGKEEREKVLGAMEPQKPAPKTDATKSKLLAGGTTVGTGESPRKGRNWSISRLEPGETGVRNDASGEEQESAPLPESFKQARMVATASAKLSYLLGAIVKYQADEQIIVFYDSENIAWYLASALDVLQVQYLIYAKSLSVERRAQYVDSFICNPTFRVLLMDINQAAFGLDIRVASRIYFINPVLNPQVEAQAIGRARRVSQLQGEVTVETLVLRDSIDEVIVERRARMTPLEHRYCKDVLDDRPIANWIKNVRIAPMPCVSGAGAGAGAGASTSTQHDSSQSSQSSQDASAPNGVVKVHRHHRVEMEMLNEPKAIFGKTFGAHELGHEHDPDGGLVQRYRFPGMPSPGLGKGTKRPLGDDDADAGGDVTSQNDQPGTDCSRSPPSRGSGHGIAAQVSEEPPEKKKKVVIADLTA